MEGELGPGLRRGDGKIETRSARPIVTLMLSDKNRR